MVIGPGLGLFGPGPVNTTLLLIMIVTCFFGSFLLDKDKRRENKREGFNFMIVLMYNIRFSCMG